MKGASTYSQEPEHKNQIAQPVFIQTSGTWMIWKASHESWTEPENYDMILKGIDL